MKYIRLGVILINVDILESINIEHARHSVSYDAIVFLPHGPSHCVYKKEFTEKGKVDVVFNELINFLASDAKVFDLNEANDENKM